MSICDWNMSCVRRDHRQPWTVTLISKKLFSRSTTYVHSQSTWCWNFFEASSIFSNGRRISDALRRRRWRRLIISSYCNHCIPHRQKDQNPFWLPLADSYVLQKTPTWCEKDHNAHVALPNHFILYFCEALSNIRKRSPICPLTC